MSAQFLMLATGTYAGLGIALTGVRPTSINLSLMLVSSVVLFWFAAAGYLQWGLWLVASL